MLRSTEILLKLPANGALLLRPLLKILIDLVPMAQALAMCLLSHWFFETVFAGYSLQVLQQTASVVPLMHVVKQQQSLILREAGFFAC